ncbi:uroporphyrinogen-III synthase [Novosphingobium sp. RD2P27]|uniref:Uroporphyrinogen-III synthase n=1 Tax=Novosphingobium kalidii TaxID=3230299 RepID=A0ABV2CXX1_9SPHN
MIPLIIVRPEPGASSTLQAARAMGMEAQAHPIFTIRPVAWTPPPRQSVDAVLLGSANAIRQGGAGLDGLRGLPAYCVGRATAEAAQAAGFPVAQVGTGGLQQVLSALAPEHRRLLRLAGVSHVPLALPPGAMIDTRVVYDSVAVPMDNAFAQKLQSPAVVLLHSGEAAAHLDTICTEAGIDRARIALAVIGPRVAPLGGQGWAALQVAAQPSDAALLALAREMCQDARWA